MHRPQIGTICTVTAGIALISLRWFARVVQMFLTLEMAIVFAEMTGRKITDIAFVFDNHSIHTVSRLYIYVKGHTAYTLFIPTVIFSMFPKGYL